MKRIRAGRGTSGNGKGKRFLAAAGIAAAAAALCAGAVKRAGRAVIGEAIDRSEPEAMKKTKDRIAGKMMTGEEKKLLAQAEELRDRLLALPAERVTVTAFDGVTLVGHILRAEHEERILIAMHGWRSSWASDYGAIAGFFRDHGCTVLYPEQRGQGESGGDYITFGIEERLDCVSWANWVRDSGVFAPLPLYLVGLSMGATTVLMAAGTDGLPSDLNGVIADCGFTSPAEIWQHVAEDNMKIPYRVWEKNILRSFEKKTGRSADEWNTLRSLECSTLPLLLIHGDADTFVPVDMSYANFAAARDPKRLLIVEGAEHGRSYIVNAPVYEEEVLSFFRSYDSPSLPYTPIPDPIRIVPGDGGDRDACSFS